jgi:histone acetyltransferase 1
MRHFPAFPPFLPLVAIESASYHITRRTLSLSMDGLARKDADEFVVRANDVIFFKLIRHESEVEDHEKESFHPEFTHQVFGESENIFGYKDLKIVLFYSSGHLRQYVSISFKEKIPASVSKGVEPDDIIGQIREHVSDKFTSNINQFTERLADEAAFRPAGEKVNQIIVQKKDSTGSRVSNLMDTIW